MENKRIAWISPHPTHYNNFLFERLLASGIQVDLFFHYRIKGNYPWNVVAETGLQSYYFTGKWDFRLISLIFRKRRDYSAIMVAGWSHPTVIILLIMLSIFGGNYGLVTDTPRPRPIKGARERLRAAFLRFLFRTSNFVLLAGSRGKDTLISWGCDRDKIHIFPFATNTDFFSPGRAAAEMASERDDLRFFSSGRLDNGLKGYDVTLAALAEFKTENKSIRLKYIVAGTGPDEQQLKSLAAKLNLIDVVEFLGWVEVAELPKLYRSCDVFVHHGVNDPFPNAVLEAMACGTLVLASDSSGSAVDRINDGINGFIFKTRSQPDLVEKLARISNMNASARQIVRDAARATAEQWSCEYHVLLIHDLLKNSLR